MKLQMFYLQKGEFMKRSVFAGTLALTACATAPNPQEVGASFDPAEVAWFQAAGSNTIKGSAVMRTVGGEPKTCAGLDANLIPDSSYARARFTKMYSSLDGGFLSATSGFKWASTDPRYETAAKTTHCDAQGFFEFDELADGTYFITAKIVWGVPMRYFTSWQGGYLMQRVSVHGGQTRTIVLTEQ